MDTSIAWPIYEQKSRPVDEDLLGGFWLGPSTPNGLTSHQVRRIVADVTAAADVVGLTIAEFFPRQVMHLQQLLKSFPLISPPTVTR